MNMTRLNWALCGRRGERGNQTQQPEGPTVQKEAGNQNVWSIREEGLGEEKLSPGLESSG